MSEDHELVDVEVSPVEEEKSNRWGLIAGGVAVVAALGFGGFAIANQLGDASEVAVAESTDDDSAQDEASQDESSEQEQATEAFDAPTDSAAVAVDTASDASFGFGFGTGEVVFADGEFVSLGHGPDGFEVSRSTNGTDWSSDAVVGLPANGSASLLAQTDSGWVTVVEIWPEFDEDDSGFYFGPDPQPERFLGFSEDLITWTTSELPEPDLDEDSFAYVQGLGAVGDQIALLMQIEVGGQDELQILFEAGVLSEADLQNYCGGGFEGDDFVAYSCNYDDYEEAMEDEFPVTTTTAPAIAEDTAFTTTTAPAITTTTVASVDIAPELEIIESEFAEEVVEEEIARLSPGDPGYDELDQLWHGLNDFEMPSPVVMAGTVDGGFTSTEIPASGYTNGLTSTDSGFALLTVDYSSESGLPEVWSSRDGVTWKQSGAIVVDENSSVSSITGSGDLLLATGQSFDGTRNGVATWVSGDLGATWTAGAIDTALFDTYGTPIAGPAGFALQLDGSTEPYEDNYVDPLDGVVSVDIVKDGYTMTIDLGNGSATLTGPDGVVIHESVNEEIIYGSGGENIVRLEGRFGDTTIWLDPVTGEDLVTITSDDINSVFDEFYNDFDRDVEEDFVEPPRATELWFSPDGETWTLLQREDVDFNQNGYSGLAGVGDDEVLIRTETWVEPPEELYAFEFENRAPTDAEIEALDVWSLENSQGSVEWTAVPVT